MMSSLPQNGGSFYTRAESEILIDPFVSPPQMQTQLAGELARCEDLVRRDYRYAHLVAGASKMPMNMIWVARNQGGDVNDRDLSMLKDVAWNEFVKKRFLPSVAEGTPVCEAAASMLEIVRSMNLQRRRFQIMGLHEQVEASELQFIIHLCQAGLLHTSDYRITANRFRRHDKFFEAFALAVGAFVCSSAPYTMGVATTQLNRSLQFEYKKQTIALFVYVLQENRGLVNNINGFDEDYVARIARLIIVSQDGNGIAGHRPEEECPKDSEAFIRAAVDAVQRQADRVERQADRVERHLTLVRELNGAAAGGVGDGGVSEGVITKLVEDTVRNVIGGGLLTEDRVKDMIDGAILRHSRIDGADDEMRPDMEGLERRIRDAVTQHSANMEKRLKLESQKNKRLTEDTVSHINSENRRKAEDARNERTQIEAMVQNFTQLVEAKDEKVDVMMRAYRTEMAAQTENHFDLIGKQHAHERESLNDLKKGVESGMEELQLRIKELNSFKDDVTGVMQTWDTYIKQPAAQSAAAQSTEMAPNVEFISAMVSKLVLENMNAKSHVFQAEIEDQVRIKVRDATQGMLISISQDVAQCKDFITQQTGELRVKTEQMNELHSMCDLNARTMHSMQSQLDARMMCVTSHEMNTKIQSMVSEIEQNFAAMRSGIDDNTELTQELIGALEEKMTAEGTSGAKTNETGMISNLETRLKDEIENKVNTKCQAIIEQGVKFGGAELQSIANNVAKSANFEEKVRSQVQSIISTNFSDIPKRVGDLERQMQTSSATAPSFNVFQQGATAANAVYRPS